MFTYGNGLALDGRRLLVADFLDDVEDLLGDVALLPVSNWLRYIASLRAIKIN